MAVDRDRQRQMACKVVKLGKSPQRLWREVELLKDISHVRKVLPLSTLAHQTSAKYHTRRACLFHGQRSVWPSLMCQDLS